MDNYCIIVENFTFRPVSDVAVGHLVFSFFPEDLLGHFFRLLRNVFLSSRLIPLDQFLLVVSTLRTDFVANVTIELSDSQKLVVTFHLLRLRAFTCCNLYRSTSLLSFSNVTVRLILYHILQ